MRFESRTSVSVLAIAGAALLAAAAVVAATGVVPATSSPGLSGGQQTQEDLQLLYQEAYESLSTAEQVFEPVQKFTYLIQRIELGGADGLDPEEQNLLARSYEGRALAYFSFGQEPDAEEDLRRLIRLAPEFEVNRSVNPGFVGLFDRLRAEVVGTLEIALTPPDAQLTIDGRSVDPFRRRYRLLAGPHSIEVYKPGHTTATRSVEVTAGSIEQIELALDRTSAVLQIMTHPSGADVYVDDRYIDTTSGTAPPDFMPRGEAAARSPQDFSDWLVIENLQPGAHQMRIEKEGYRPIRNPVQIGGLIDYTLPPFLLERTEGIVSLDNLPSGATVTVNGEAMTPERAGANEPPRLRLAPGDYRILVQQGTAGTFEESVTLADRQQVTLRVSLRPAVALLGILGGDDIGADKLEETLRSGFASSEQWTLLDRAADSRLILDESGLTTDALRALSESARVASAGIAWSSVQQTVDREVTGSVYILAVLNDDLLATQADLWVWPAAPGPAMPDRLRVDLDDPSTTTTVLESFSISLLNGRAWFGALLIDSLAAGGPVVASVTAAGPAEAAGLQLGDRVVAVGGTMVADADDATDRIVGAGPDQRVTITVARGGGEQQLDVRLGRSPVVLPLNAPNRVYAAVWAAAQAELRQPDSEIPEWVLRLNMAGTQIHAGAWEQAVNTLRRIQDAPTGPGLGEAARRYWLGIALDRAGPNYLDAARQELEAAAAAPEARLYHHDGPWVAPRARARLAVLRGT